MGRIAHLAELVPDPETRRFLRLVYQSNQELAADLALELAEGALTDGGWIDERGSSATGDFQAAPLSAARDVAEQYRQMRAF